MVRREVIYKKFEERFGEIGYSAHQISRMLEKLGIDRFVSAKIRDYAIDSGLAVNLKRKGIKPGENDPKYLIPKSNLEALIQGLHISRSIQQLEEAASQLGYRV